MNIFKLLQNPIIKTIGVGCVLYYGLFYNKENPNALGNRLSSENIKKNVDIAGNNARFIAAQLRNARNHEKEENHNPQDGARCGDSARISYGIYNQSGRQIDFFNMQHIILNDHPNFLAQHVFGMKKDETKIITFNTQSKITDPNLAHLEQYKSLPNTELHIKLLSFSRHPDQISCSNINPNKQ